MKTAIYLLLAILFLAVSVISCSEEPKALIPTDTPSTETPTTPTTPGIQPPAGVPSGSYVYLQVGTRWESAGDTADFQNWKTCSINAASPSTELLCEVSIPEAQLYYSAVQFKMGSLQPAYCPILSFTPYYYKRSEDAPREEPGPPDAEGNPTTVTVGGYVPPGAEPSSSPLNCSSGTLTAACYGGAAPIMVEGFPKHNGNYFLTSIQDSHGYVLNSSNSLRYYGTARVNYTTTNNLSEANRAIAFVGGTKERVADSFQDYEITCRSYWGEKLFGIKLILSDENWDDSGGLDHYTDWN